MPPMVGGIHGLPSPKTKSKGLIDMLKMTNRDVLDYIMNGVNELMNTEWESLEEWAEAIDIWCDDYESGVFDDLKIEAHDVYYDEVLRSCYHKLVDQLETIGDMMYNEWEQTYKNH